MNTYDQAVNCIEQKWAPVPVPHKSKNPGFKGWQGLRIKTKESVADYFKSEQQNIGIILGDASGGLVDIDLDCPEALQAAPYFLPDTGMKHGRKSTPNSHLWYKCPGITKSLKFTDFEQPKKDGMIVEIRSNGGHTLIPPSVHPGGEQLQWSDDKIEPAYIEPQQLLAAVKKVAAVSIIARYWGQGSRHEVSLALGGLFCRIGLPVEEALKVIEVVCIIASDDEIEDRKRAISDSYESIKNGREVAGKPKIAELLGMSIPDELEKWLAPEKSEIQSSNLPRLIEYDLLKKEFPELRFAVPDYVPEGLVVLAGMPKIGKSWLAYDICIAVATGGEVLGKQVEQGRAIYFALEDGARRLQSRLIQLLGEDIPMPEKLHLGEADSLDALDRGGLEQLENLLKAMPDTKVLVIDTLQKIKGNAKKSNAYEEDVRVLSPLQKLAIQHRISLILITHVRKEETSDPFARVTGSMGITGTADATITLSRARGENVADYWLTGRDIDEEHLMLQFDKDTAKWIVLGNADIHLVSTAKQKVYEALCDFPQGLSPSVIKEMTGKTIDAVNTDLQRLKKEGLVENPRKGLWRKSPYPG